MNLTSSLTTQAKVYKVGNICRAPDLLEYLFCLKTKVFIAAMIDNSQPRSIA